MTALIESKDVDIANVEATARRIAAAGQIADAMFKASVLPEHLRTHKVNGKVEPLSEEQIKANCVMIVSQALRWRVDPFAILGSTFVIHGRLGFDGKLIAGIVNTLGGLSKKLSYEFQGSGDKLTVTVSGTLDGETEPRTLSVSVGEAKTDNDIWKKDPHQKLVYTGATRWARRHCPQVLLGIMTDDAEASGPLTIEADALPKPSNDATTDADEPTEPIDMVDVIDRYKAEIDAADNADDVKKIGERINAELALTEFARTDLRLLAVRKWKELSEEPAPIP